MKKYFALLLTSILLVTSCTSCVSTAPESEDAPQPSSTPVTSQTKENDTVTLSVYLEAVYTDEEVHFPIYEKLKAFEDSHPEIHLEFVSPVSGASDPAARETEINQLNTEIITGGGPDIFLMQTLRFTDENLFPDVQKAMKNHSFLNLSDYADANSFDPANYYSGVLAAGQLDDQQYILPLSFSVPLFVGAENVITGSGYQPEMASANQTAFFEELSRVLNENGKQVEYSLSLTNLLDQPLIDYQEGAIQLDTDAVRQALTIEKDYTTHQLNFFNNYDSQQIDALAAGTPFGLLEMSDIALGTLHPLDTKGIAPFVQGIPNENGSITAEISSYAMASAGTQYPEQCAELLYYLMSAECQDAAAYPSTTEELPVRRDSMKASLESAHQFLVYDASKEKLSEDDIAFREKTYGGNLQDTTVQSIQSICDQITSAHFHTIWYSALELGQSETGDDVLTSSLNDYLYGNTSLDELIDTLTPRLQMYLDE